MFLKRTRKNKNIDKREQLIKLVASFIFLIGSFMYIGRIAYNYYVELRDYNKAKEFLNIGKEEIEEIKVDIDEEEIKEQPKQEERILTDREKELRKKASESGNNQSNGGKKTLTVDDIANMSDEDFEKLTAADLE